MRRARSLLLAISTAALAATTGCGGAPDAITVTDAYVRLPAVPGSPAAAYFTVRGGDVADRLLSVQSEMVPRIELHASMMKAGAMTMAPLPGVDVPADEKVEFTPGGRHAMLFEVPAAIQPGTQVPLTFRFRSGAMAGAAARAIAPGVPAP
jgi:copper(I)-binding protein